MEFEQIFLSLKHINADIRNPRRQDLALDILKRFPTTEENAFKKFSPIDQQVAKLLAQYAMNISQDNSRDTAFLENLVKITKSLIVGAEGYRENRLINNIVIELRTKEKDLDEQIKLINHLQESAKIAASLQELTNRNTAARQARIKMAQDKVTKEDVAAFKKHVELYNKQQDAIDYINRLGIKHECVPLIKHLLIEQPTPEMYYKKYMGGGTRSKKSKTRRRRHRN